MADRDFDIPDRFKKAREALREKIKRSGFYKIAGISVCVSV